MSKFDEKLHNDAMDIAEDAFLARLQRDHGKAEDLFKKAFELEKKAALLIIDEYHLEPSRSVTFQSAASLAFNAGLYREAEKMINLALAGDPPELIADELRDLYEDVNFKRHLELKGVELGDDQYQLVIAGPSVGPGIAKSDEFTKRLDAIKKITHRTAQRLNKQPYQDRGRFPDAQKDMYDLYISSNIRAASFAATIRLGSPVESKKFQELESEKTIIDDIIDSLELVNDKKEAQLKEKIKDDAYFRNFVGLARELAPDGENINLVGLTAKRKKKEKTVAFMRVKQDISHGPFMEKEPDSPESESKIVEIKGNLDFADAAKNKIKLTTEDNKRWNVIVPDGLGDIVKPYWEEDVIVRGVEKEKNKTLVLNSIDKA